MVDDLQEYHEDSTKHQNDTTESANGRLTARLCKLLNSRKQKAPGLDNSLHWSRGFFVLRLVVFDRLNCHPLFTRPPN